MAATLMAERGGAAPPLVTAEKAVVWQAMREKGMRKADLARALGWNQKQVDRLLDPRNPSKPDVVEAALAGLGKRLRLALADVA